MRLPLTTLAVLAASVIVTVGAGHAAADDVHLTNGGMVEGKAQRVGDKVVVETPTGKVELAASEVARIVPGKTRHDHYVERRDALEKGDLATDADAHVALGDWCKENGLRSEARRHWRRAAELDADHRAAHGRLGHVRHEGKWMTEAEYYEARGFVRKGGEWVHEDEVARETERRRRERARRDHERKVKACIRRMASMKRKTRLTAKVELQEYAESVGDLRLAAFASRVAEHYNDQWRQVRLQLSSGRVLTEIRATSTNLKRPIREIQTSLGANSTPVRIQLPELSIAQVRTTVLVPADIELDEDD